jgi:transketolase
MRNTFIKSLTKLAEEDPDIVLLTGDLGFGVFEEFEAKFPGQYFNVGIAEQNMMGLAVGLSREGKKVVTYSIGNFSTLRCLEQIRNDACYHNANIIIVSNGGGFSYGALGMSHHTTEDLAIMRALPGMTVVAPCTQSEVDNATKSLIKRGGVSYLRLDKTIADDGVIVAPFSIGKIVKYREGKELTLIAIGGILQEALSAANELSKLDVDLRVLGVHTLKPLDEQQIIMAAKETKGIITIEEHNIIGGLASAVAETCIDNNLCPSIFKKIGLDDKYSSIVGSQNFLRQKYKMDCNAIFDSVLDLLGLD